MTHFNIIPVPKRILKRIGVTLKLILTEKGSTESGDIVIHTAKVSHEILKALKIILHEPYHSRLTILNVVL